MTALVDVFTRLPAAVIYAVAGIVVAAETGTIVGLLVPGEITLLLVGFLCSTGTLHLSIALPAMIFAGLVGDHLGYREGRRMGPRVRDSRLGRRVGSERWARAEEMLRRSGGRAVALARFVAFARTLTPRLVGMSVMPYRRFAAWNLVGVVGCVGASVIVGFTAGRSYATVAQVVGRVSSSVVILLLVIVALVLIGRYLGHHPAPVSALTTRMLRWPPLRSLGRFYRDRFVWLSGRVGVGGAVAVNTLGGAALLLVIGCALTWTVDSVVRHSGLPLVDSPVASWITARRTRATVDTATDTLSILRGSYLMMVVAVLAVVLNWRSRVWRTDFVGVLGSVGAIMPLALISVATAWTGPVDSGKTVGLLPNQTVIVTVGLCMIAWLISHRFGWAVGATAWTAAVIGLMLVGLARVYTGSSLPSQTIAAVLLGGLWVLIFVVAWHTRERVLRSQPRTAVDNNSLNSEALDTVPPPSLANAYGNGK